MWGAGVKDSIGDASDPLGGPSLVGDRVRSTSAALTTWGEGIFSIGGNGGTSGASACFGEKRALALGAETTLRRNREARVLRDSGGSGAVT